LWEIKKKFTRDKLAKADGKVSRSERSFKILPTKKARETYRKHNNCGIEAPTLSKIKKFFVINDAEAFMIPRLHSPPRLILCQSSVVQSTEKLKELFLPFRHTDKWLTPVCFKFS